jgi:hypothetical protein
LTRARAFWAAVVVNTVAGLALTLHFAGLLPEGWLR